MDKYSVNNISGQGLVEISADLKNTQEMIRSLAEESHHATGELNRSRSRSTVDHLLQTSAMLQIFSEKSIPSPGQEVNFRDRPKVDKEVRSFFSLNVARCECLSIALALYDQLIDHLRGAGEYVKLFESYLEYANLCVTNSNETQALCLLNEAEAVIRSDNYWSHKHVKCKFEWFKDFCLGRIASLRGGCMLENGEYIEARKHLNHALDLFRDPFPTTKYQQRVRRMHTAVRHWLALNIAPKNFVGTETGLVGFYYDEVATTLNRFYKLFIGCKEYSNADLTAKWSFDYALRSNSNFRLLCECYGNIITTHFNNQEFTKCVKLVKLVIELCRRKHGQLDPAEARAVRALYTSVFLFYVEYGKKNESLDFGLPVMHMMSLVPEPSMRLPLVVSVLRLLLSDLRLHEMGLLMKETLYTDAQFDLSSTTWYYTYSLRILIETGYSIESYKECERFYFRHGDSILTSKSKDAAWDYFGCMWLINIRACAWETSVLWEEKLQEIMSTENKQVEYKLNLQLILLEGWLIKLVREIDAMNENKIVALKKTVKTMFDTLSKTCRRAPIHQPRFDP